MNVTTNDYEFAAKKRFIILREANPFRVFNPTKTRSEVTVDKDGFFNPSKVHDQADVEIFFLGGSTTECFAVEGNQRFPFLVGRMLETKTGLKINSYNGGTSGNDIINSQIKLLNVVLPKEPDHIVLMHNINDMINMLYTGSYWSKLSKHRLKTYSKAEFQQKQLVNNAPFSKGFFFPNLQLQVHRLMNSRSGFDEWQSIRNTSMKIDTAQFFQDFESALQSFVHTCKAWGTTVTLMTQQNRITMKDSSAVFEQLGLQKKLENRTSIETFQRIYSNANDIVRKVAKEHQLLLIDLDRSIPKRKEFIFDAVHLTSEGSQLMAEVISDSLLQHFALPSSQKTVLHE